MNVLNSGAAETRARNPPADPDQGRPRGRTTWWRRSWRWPAVSGPAPKALRPTMFAVDPLYIHGVPAIERVIIEGPYNPTGPGDTPSRRAIFTCKPARRRATSCRARGRSCRGWRSAPTGGVHRRRPAAAPRPVSQGPRQRQLRGRDPAGAAGRAHQPELPVPRRERPGANSRPRPRIASAIVDLASRLSFFLWSSIPDEALLDAGGRESAAAARRARAGRFAGCWATRGRSALVDELRRPVAAPAQPRGVRARPATTSRSSTTLLRQAMRTRDRDAARQPAARRPQRRSTCCAPTTPSRTSGWRATTGCAASTAATSGACR